MIDLIAADPMFGMSREELTAHLEPERYIGRCPEQVTEFLATEIPCRCWSSTPRALDGTTVELKV